MRRGAVVLGVLLGASGVVGGGVACGGARGGAAGASAPGTGTADANGSADAGASEALRACTHEAKDFAPCIEDCNRGIAFGCAIAAGRFERGEALDLTRSVHMYERACELRDAAACVSAARMHASGHGVPPSRARQVELLATACALGDALACAIPAKAYAKGSGVPKDERRAKDLRERACAGGAQDACDAIDDPASTGER